ncbi:hypothetical protein WMF04_03570 [Sorangium sp. So ce260]|uniref:hypothetical protein n=1 Tax=Sorangium sp. So ce260 TaxID=3133291 RepID=UPI003F629B27
MMIDPLLQQARLRGQIERAAGAAVGRSARRIVLHRALDELGPMFAPGARSLEEVSRRRVRER